MKPQALLFDVFGTLVDWRTSIATHVTAAFAEKGLDVDGPAFADAWRAEYQPCMDRIRAGKRGWAPLDDLHVENLMVVLGKTGQAKTFSPDEIMELGRAWEDLSPWPDTASGLVRLKAHHIIAPCSNGSIALLTRLAKYARLPFDCILGAEIAHDYKPSPVVYQASCDALQLEPAEVMMVAAHNGDLAAAQACGLQTAFIPRPTEYGPDQTTDLEPTGDWTLTARDVRDLASQLE